MAPSRDRVSRRSRRSATRSTSRWAKTTSRIGVKKCRAWLPRKFIGPTDSRNRMAGVAIPRSATVAATRSSKARSSGESGWPSGSTTKACLTRAFSPLSFCARNPLENGDTSTCMESKDGETAALYGRIVGESIQAGLGRRRTSLLFSMVGTADERAGLHMAEAQREPLLLEQPELLRRVEAHDRPMDLGWLQVLPDRHHVAPDRSQVAHHFSNLFGRLPHSDHETRFRPCSHPPCPV